MDQLLRVFPMRSCSAGVFKRAKDIGRPCLLGDIGKCAAPCIGRVDAAGHRQLVDDFCAFLAGNTASFVKRLQAEMYAASEELDFERAARLRDDLAALDRVLEKQAVVLGDATDADVIALAEDPLEVAVQIFHVRGGRIRGQRGWVAEKVDDADTGQLIERFLVQLYDGESADAVPREILVPTLPPASSPVQDWLVGIRGSSVQLRVPQRGSKRTLHETVTRNAEQALVQHKLKRSSDLTTRSQALEEIQEALGLAESPLRIECFDVSNLQSDQIVASMVVFEDGLARKSDYRRFVVRSLEGQSDVGAMREVLTRRFRRLLDDRDAPAEDPETGRARKFAYPPRLVVVDGGPPQVAVAAEVLTRLGLDDIAVCGLAKRLEEVWLPGEEDPLILPRTSEGLYLLQRVRDEAHRFAITFHRSRRSSAMVESLLDDVPGLGEVRRKALLKRFGSLRKLRAATVEEIAAVPGIGPQTATAVKVALEGVSSPTLNTMTGELEGAEEV
jgi:excinuclease ABC subunit C